MKHILRFTNSYKEHSYFLAHGDPWPHRPEFRLISHVTPHRDKARRFDDHAGALGAITLAGDALGWEIDEVRE